LGNDAIEQITTALLMAFTAAIAVLATAMNFGINPKGATLASVIGGLFALTIVVVFRPRNNP
jgi:hypothetical protein